MDPRISLFDVVTKMHDAGVVKLSNSERDLIARETRDLIEKSVRNRKADKMPEGFEEVVNSLKSADPEEAYDLVVKFLKEKGVIKGKEDKKDEKGEKPGKDEKGEKSEKPEMGKGPGPQKEMKGPKGEEPEMGESFEHEKSESPEEEKSEHGGMGGGMPFGKGAQAEPSMDLEDDAEDEGKTRLKELQEKVEAVPATTSVESMGMMDDKGKKGGKYRVLITAERNLVASHVDRGPLFHAIPSEEYKRNTKALKRLANQVMGTLIFQGPKAAATLCGTTLLAGVDDDVKTTGSEPISSNTDSVSDNAQAVNQGGVDSPATSVLDGADNDTVEDPDKISPTNREGVRKPARYTTLKKSDTSIDNIETDAQEKPDEVVKDVRDGAENVTVEDPEKPENDTIGGGEVDFQTVEANYRQLYAARAKKMAEEAVASFTERFNSCIRIASARMRLNQDSHPFKVAAADVLLSEDVEFTDGDKFVPMDARTASELIELIAAEGHDEFVNHLLARAADLMDKDAKYLKDVETDLRNLAPISIESAPKTSSRTTKTSMRDKAIAGSFAANNRVLPQHPEKVNKKEGVRDAIVGNRLGRRLNSLRG